MKREDVLRNAEACVTKQRQDQYGAPEQSFGVIALMWSAYLGAPITAVDVACMMVLLKVARARAKPNHADNYVDIAGYAACGGEIACD